MTATAEQPTTADERPLPDHVRVGILGAGFSGLGMAIRLKQAGIEDFLICERDADVGGTWWANTYPGCQCDIPSADRKSTRLNSSHANISYAVFCLKKKKNNV